jgi:flagellar motor switch protein FliG
MDAYKKTALVLYGLHETDKEWLLSHLPAQQKIILKGRLEELEALGIQPVEQDLSTIIREFTEKYKKVVEKEDEIGDLLEKIDAVSLNSIQPLLDNESEQSVALILAVSNWSWASQYLSTLTIDKKDKIRQYIKDSVGNIAPGVRNAIVGFLNEQLVLNKFND